MTTIAAHAARRAEARFHAHCDAHDPCFGIDIMERQHRLGDPPPPGLAFHTIDHRAPAERKAAALDALADAYTLAPVLGDKLMIAQIYDSVRNRTEDVKDA